jgi:arylsulfatase A-like enzyme
MNRREFLTSTAAAATISRRAEAAPASRPNIVLILADDFGFGSLNCYGADKRLVRTPNLDRLAREGVRFTDANTPSSVCSPSRYSVLTGRYCWRTPLKNGVLSTYAPLHIETDRMTIASLLKSQGYQTAAVGKWHLGYGAEKAEYTKPLKPGPLQIGFDYHFAIPQNHGDATGIYVENEAVVGLRSSRIQPFGKTYYGRPWMGIDAPQRTDDTAMEVLTGRAVDWLNKRDAKTPFFLYFTPVAVHEPATPSAATRGTSGAGPYGDWIHDLDLSVGRILKSLDDKGFAKDTLVIFTSDNGGVFLTQGERPEAAAYRAGLRVNGDWRGGKHGIYQGGFRVPYMVRWPGKAPAGATCDETINLVDTLATVAAITGQKLPPAEAGAEDSTNVLPAFLGKKAAQPLRDSMISHSADGNFAIRQGPWKYVEGKPSVPENRVAAPRRAEMARQLYNLRDDPGEQNNLMESQAEVSARLADLLSTSRAQTHTRRR